MPRPRKMSMYQANAKTRLLHPPPGEVCINQLAIIQRLAHQPTHKLEEVQVADASVVLHDTVGVGLESGATLRDVHKEGQVGVEDLPRHHLQVTVAAHHPFSADDYLLGIASSKVHTADSAGPIPKESKFQ